MTVDAAIDYRIADLETLELPQASFDLAYSSLTFHYIRDFGRLVRMVHHALTPGTHFVFTIEHPIYMAAAHPHWTRDEDGRKTWPVNGYSVEGARRTGGAGSRSAVERGAADEALIQAVVTAVNEFSGAAPQSDDLTMLAVSYRA